MQAIQETDFVAVGAGPKGAALAFSRAKISESTSVVMIDHEEEKPFDVQRYDSMVFAINSGSRRLFEQVDVWQQIRVTRACAYDLMHVWDALGTGSVTFSAEELDLAELGFIIEAAG